MTMLDHSSGARDANARLAWTLARAVEGSARPRYEIARSAGLHKETLLRTLRGEKPISIGQAASILRACEVPANVVMALALAGHEELAAEWMHSEMGSFLDEFFVALPGSLRDALGDRVNELKPRWAHGAARMLAKTLTQHVADLDRRGDALDAYARSV
jgi:antitoxin HigA-1